MDGIQKNEMKPESGEVEKLTGLLGRPLRSYRDFADGAAKAWNGQ